MSSEKSGIRVTRTARTETRVIVEIPRADLIAILRRAGHPIPQGATVAIVFAEGDGILVSWTETTVEEPVVQPPPEERLMRESIEQIRARVLTRIRETIRSKVINEYHTPIEALNACALYAHREGYELSSEERAEMLRIASAPLSAAVVAPTGR